MPEPPPGVPWGLTAQPGNGLVSLSWNQPTSGSVTGYKVYVDGAYSATVSGRSHTVTGLVNGTVRTFSVSAYNVVGESARSGGVPATPNPPPNVPTGVAVASGDTTLSVTWTAPSGGTPPTHYRVYRNGMQVGQVAAPTTAFTDNGLVNGTSYAYRVTAFSTVYGESAQTAALNGTPYGAPAVPTGVTVAGGSASATVSWPAVTPTADRPVTGYRVYVNGAGSAAATTTGTSATVSGLTNGTTYTFEVAAYNAAAESARSAGVTGYVHTPLTGVVANLYNSCGITEAAHAVCWGDAYRGDGAASGYSVTPTTVQTSAGVPLIGVVEIGDAANGTCARTTAGWVYCWGGNVDGMIGDGTTTTSLYAKRTGTLTGITDIAVASEHVCATNGSSVWCWGDNSSSQVDGVAASTTAKYLSPRLLSLSVPAGATVAQLGTATDASCARFSNGEVQCWGAGEFLGRNTTLARNAPGKVWAVGSTGATFLSDATALTSGGNTQICALRSTVPTTVACWGNSTEGQLGDGGTMSALVPRTVVGPSGTGSLAGMTTVAAGTTATCAANGTAAYCWGRNTSGQLGAGSAVTSSNVPLQVAGVGGTGTLSGVTSIAVGANHVCAGTADRTVHCWGGNGYGQLGQPVAMTKSTTPMRMTY
jgi:hypothetical protein